MHQLSVLQALSALSLLSTTLAHMQMSNPSPLRDPHANRLNEPKDYNILNPLNSDGSNFACKGYQWNTPWTPVATYEAGGTYNMSIIGGATHGGGSCQLSFSCDGGINFKVVKSIIGGCPSQPQYPFTVPVELGRLGRTTCLFAWTWFNKVGNREMYMNCAVVNIIPWGTRTSSSKPSPSQHLTVRETAKVNAVAQAALASYPDLFVANLAGINNCVAPETHDVVFGDPGRAVQFGDNVGSASKPTFQRNACTGKGHTSAGTSSDSSSSSPPSSSVSSTTGDDGQWHAGHSTQQQSSTPSSSTVAANDGKYNPSMYGSKTGQNTPSPSLALQQNSLQPVDVHEGNKQPNAQVQKELNAYLARLYGTKTPNKQREACTMEDDDAKDTAILAHTLTRTRRQKRRSAYQSLNPDRESIQEISSNTQTTAESDMSTPAEENNSVAALAPQSIDASFAAFLQRLNSLSNSLFTLVKFASSYLDQAPPAAYYGTSTTTPSDENDSDAESSDAAFTAAKQNTKRSSPSLPAHGEMSDTPEPSTTNTTQALKHWLEELIAQIAAMKILTQSTAARFGAKNDSLRQRRQIRPVERPFDWGSLYSSLKTNDSGASVNAQPNLPGVGGQQAVQPTNTTTTMTTGTSTSSHNNSQSTNQTIAPNATPTTVPKDSWIDGVFPFLLPSSATPSSGADSDAAALFPFIMAPGPVLPAGVNVEGGGNLEHMPVVVDDLKDGEGSEAEAEDGVRKFFEGLGGESGGVE